MDERKAQGRTDVHGGIVSRLIRKGVRIPAPSTVEIDDDVNPDRISGDGVVLHPGTRLAGARTLLCAGVRLGAEGPVSVVDCRLGPRVELKGGFFKGSVFLAGANMGSGAQVREGCILEEEANGSHTVGLKQTILFPFVTLGSLINFCDCFMAGGTSRKNHSEVGSSYIHFNYTPNQDKATASLLGDVPSGVMLRTPPIFLGGQGGLVGPARIGYGTVIAAGAVCRRDCPAGGMLLTGDGAPPADRPFVPGLYGDIRRRVANNIDYIANLLALRQWYRHVRGPLMQDGPFGPDLWAGLVEVLDGAIAERRDRFKTLAGKMEASIRLAEAVLPREEAKTVVRQQRELFAQWPRIEAELGDARETEQGCRDRDIFLAALWKKAREKAEQYPALIQSLDEGTVSRGTAWLAAIVADAGQRAREWIPSCRL